MRLYLTAFCLLLAAAAHADDLQNQLCVAAHDGRIAVVQQLLDRGANPKVVCDNGGGNALERAVGRNHPDIVRLLMARFVWTDEERGDAFESGIYLRSVASMQAMLDLGVPVDIKDHQSESAFLEAAWTCDLR